MASDSIFGEATLARGPNGVSFTATLEILDGRLGSFLANMPDPDFESIILELFDRPIHGEKAKEKQGLLALALQLLIITRESLVHCPELFRPGSAGAGLNQDDREFRDRLRRTKFSRRNEFKPRPLFVQIAEHLKDKKRADWAEIFKHFRGIAPEELSRYKNVDSLRTSFHKWHKRRKRPAGQNS